MSDRKGNLLMSVGEIHHMARTMKHYEFVNWLFEKTHGLPSTVSKADLLNRTYFQLVEIKKEHG